MSSACALVVEDEPDLARLVAYHLERAGFEVVLAYDGAEALARVAQRVPDVVLLDLALPVVDGYDVCRRLRADPRTQRVGIIMMTARGLSHDRVAGLEVGADDYVVKPFDLRELMLRAKAVARRSGELPAAGDDNRLTAGPITIDRTQLKVYVDGRELVLRRLELLVLELLMTNPFQIYSRAALLTTVWQVKRATNARIVDVTISRLRERLGSAGMMIETVPGIGYRLRQPRPSA